MADRTVSYFISYAHADRTLRDALVEELEKQLGACDGYAFKRREDLQILAGENWNAEIQAAIGACDFGLLLVSPAFLGSEYIGANELPRFTCGEKPCVPVALCRINFAIFKLKGLDTKQIFRFTPPRAKEPKTFGDCTAANHKRDFAAELCQQIVSRLEKYFADDASGVSQRRDGINEETYRKHIHWRYRHLPLERLSDKTNYRDIELQKVFISQDARDCREWLLKDLEAPATPDLNLDAWNEHKRFRDTEPRDIRALLDDPSVRCRVVLGAPGAGKSSLARMRLLTWETEPASSYMPVLVKLRRFHQSGRADFFDYLENDGDRIFRFRAADLRARLDAGKAELIFDGLDEIFDRDKRKTVAHLIVRCAEQFPRARILVTSRLIGYPGGILYEAGFAHWLLADFDDKKIDEFLKKWIEGAVRDPRDGPLVLRRMKDALRNPVIREMAGNPLLLTLMAGLAPKSDLPHDLASLYTLAADVLLEEWDTHRDLLAVGVKIDGVLIDHKDKHNLLRDLAWGMQTGQRGQRGNLITKEEVERAMDAAFQKRITEEGTRRAAIKQIIEQLTERNYILCHVGGAQFAFVHRGFLEFFASEHLVNLIETKPDTALADIAKIYRDHASEEAWREVLILAATRFKPAEADQVLHLLLCNVDREAVGKAVFERTLHPFVLACAVLGRAREPGTIAETAATARREMEAWIRDYPNDRHSGDWVRLLANSLPDERTRALLTHLADGDEDTRTRSQAVLSLAEHFRDSRETEDMLRSIAANERGKEIIQQATALPTRSVDARAHLQSFLATSATDKS